MTTKTLTGTYWRYTQKPGVTAINVEATASVYGVAADRGYAAVTVYGASVTNSGGSIVGGAGAKTGGAGILQPSGSSITVDNSGLIRGGTGLLGGYGVDLQGPLPSTVANSGQIYGGAGVKDNSGNAPGGCSTYFASGGTLYNSGVIKGGSTGGGSYTGCGVTMAGSGTITNTGTIVSGRYGSGNGGFGNYGALMCDGGSVTNGSASNDTALIAGTVGVQIGGLSPHRVYLNGPATVTNYGVIEGKTASVVLTLASDRLVAEPGSAFVGPVFGGAGTLELAGGAGVITNLGGSATLTGAVSAQFGGFGSYAIDAGGSWGLAGTNSLSAGQTLTAKGAVKLQAAASLNNAGLVNAASGGAIKLKGAVENAGKLRADTGGSLEVTGALDNAGVVKTMGGDLSVDEAVTGAGRAVVNGGTLTFAGSFDQDVAFTGSTGGLVLAQSRSYGGQISGFSTTGSTSLDLEDIGFVDAGQASFLGTTSSGVLTVSDGTHTAHITLIGDYTNSVFVASSDGHGGTNIVDPTVSNAVHGFSAAMAGMGGGSGGYLRRTNSPALYGHPTLIAPR